MIISENREDFQKKRATTLQEFNDDPYMGYQSFNAAIADAKITSQTEVLARLLNRENVFISGLAGSGKTTVINRFINFIDAEFDGAFNIAVTASTGIAATLLGGSTLHSWAGLGISTDDFNPKNLSPYYWSRVKNLRYVDVLIIDEISMLPAYLFTKLDATLKHARRNDEPFGGVQIIAIGDFLQLPPVESKDSQEVDNRFAIETDSWKKANFSYCFLDRTYRATDIKLKKVLLDISKNNVTDKTKALIESRMSNSAIDTDKIYTTLFTTNKNVDKYNQEELDKNPEPIFTFKTLEFGDKKFMEKAYKKNGAPEAISVKVGATVIFTKNVRAYDAVKHTKIFIANGSIGVIKAIETDRILIKLNNGDQVKLERATMEYTENEEILVGKVKKTYPIVKAYLQQFPIKLGYAITVHKSQGQTFDGVVVNLSNCFQEGLGYVALSRVRTLDDLVITGFNPKAYRVSDKSQKISSFVKVKAFRSRKEFLEKIDHYDSLLTNFLYRIVLWDKEATSEIKWNEQYPGSN